MKLHNTSVRLVSAKEGARFYGIGLSTYWRWLKQGLIPSPIRIGGRTFWYFAELEAHLEDLKKQRALRK